MKRAAIRPGRRDDQGGFALIEAIAVMLLSGLVMLTLLIATDLITRNARAATQRANAIEGLTTGLAALRRDIAAASFTRAGEAPDSPVLFEGAPRALSLARSTAGSGEQSAGPTPAGSLIRIESRYEQGRGLLVRSEAPMGLMNAGFAGAAFGSPVVLLTGPWTYRLSYGRVTGPKMVWQETWTNARALPEVVRLEILDGGSGRLVATPLLVPLRVDAEIRCVPGEGGGCEGGGGEDQPQDEQQDEPEFDNNGPDGGDDNGGGETGG
jgi:type II secretory pathway pseudopilin PulG